MPSFYDVAFERHILPRIEKALPRNADDWALYAGELGADQAADELSTELKQLLSNTARAFVAGTKRLAACRDKHSAVGAADTEPRVVIEAAIADLLRYLANVLF